MKQEQEQLNESAQRFLIVIYGLPASGKTTLSKMIKKQFFSQSIVISSDTIQMLLSQNLLFVKDIDELADAEYIQKLKIIENISMGKKPTFDSQKWKQSREFIEQQMSRMIKLNSIILQDDLLLRSQRKIFRKLSWIQKFKYLQIFMNHSASQCIQNLRNRNQITGDSVITLQVIMKAAEKLQVDQNQYCINIRFEQIKNLSKKALLQKMRAIEIHPNDPNDPNQQKNQKPKHVHSTQQAIQLQVRSFIHKIMKMQPADLELIMHRAIDKKQLGALLSAWKKKYMKWVDRTVDHQNMQSHLALFTDNKL